MQKRLFIISNRLPVNISVADDKVQVNVSSGGLVSAMNSFLNDTYTREEYNITEKYWVGVPGCNNTTWASVQSKLEESDYEYIPVFMAKKVYEAYYNGLSNSIIWPVFHYFPSYAEFNTHYFDAYLHANTIFADILIRHLHPNDIVWIHDYHLLPLAGLIRKAFPNITIGFFLHIPFPSYEIFRIMPKKWQKEIIQGMLGADLIGFHTIDYAGHFLKSAQMLMGLDNDTHTMRYNNRLIKVDVFPISIDFNKFNNAFDDPEVVKLRDSLKHQFNNLKVIFSVDRLDYTKGVYSRLKAYEQFIKKHPEYKEKVVFVLVIVPSRDGISKYAERKKMIDEYIGKLNSSIGTINWQPVIYQYNTLDFTELMAMYTTCDLALITPLRDGMNLVAKEFVASRKDNKGVLILSEMAGAARELTDALTINPNDTDEIVLQIKTGLEMDDAEQGRRMAAMQERIRQYDVITWAADFFEQLKNIKLRQKEYEIKFFDNDAKIHLLDKFKAASKCLFLLDYDGTLTPFAPHPSAAKPNSHLLDLLKNLSENEQNEIFIISGRDSKTLDEWIGHLPVNIISEHGANFRYKGEDWHPEPLINNEWIKPVKIIMNNYVRRCPNSFIEMKEYSVAWHYRNADKEHGILKAAELYNELLGYNNSMNMNIQIIKGNKVVEARNKGINKGTAVKKILQSGSFDFILACGDDVTDEDMFYCLTSLPYAFTIKVGAAASFAKYNLHTPQMILSLLETLQYVEIKQE